MSTKSKSNLCIHDFSIFSNYHWFKSNVSFCVFVNIFSVQIHTDFQNRVISSRVLEKWLRFLMDPWTNFQTCSRRMRLTLYSFMPRGVDSHGMLRKSLGEQQISYIKRFGLIRFQLSFNWCQCKVHFIVSSTLFWHHTHCVPLTQSGFCNILH